MFSVFVELITIYREYATEQGYSVDKEFSGHGIGRHFHEPPLIYHFDNDEGVEIIPGMVFTVGTI